jgi:hypothetical protein
MDALFILENHDPNMLRRCVFLKSLHAVINDETSAMEKGIKHLFFFDLPHLHLFLNDMFFANLTVFLQDLY